MLTDDQRRELGAEYSSALFEVDFEDGTARFRAGPNATNRPPFFLVTAYNPGIERPSAAENEHANKALHALLVASNIAFLPARGSSDPETHTEPSFALFDVSQSAALDIGRRFRQAAIFAWDGHTGRIVWCD